MVVLIGSHHLFVTKSLLICCCFDPFLEDTRIYGHLRWPFFSPFGYGKLLELVSFFNFLNNLEGMTIFGRNDNNPEGMTTIRKE